MLKAIFDWFKQPDPKSLAPAVQPEAVPYKVETPAQVAPTLAPVVEAAPVAEVAPQPKSTAKPVTAKPATPKPAARKPAAMKAPAKKPPVKNTRAKKPNQ